MRPEIILRWLGRVWGITSTMLLLAFMFGGREHFRPTSFEAIGLLFFPFGVIIGFFVAWWRDRLGGLITLVSFTLFCVWIFTRDGRIAVSPYFMLFVAPGFIHLLSDLIARRATLLPANEV